MDFKACVIEQFNQLWELLERTYWDFLQTSLPFLCFWLSRVAVSKQAGVPRNVAQVRCYHQKRDQGACAVDSGVWAGCLLMGTSP